MKIIINNPNKQVLSAKSEINDLSLSILVKFRDICPEYFWMPGSVVELCVYGCESYYDEMVEMDKVTFIPENIQESHMLACVQFDSMNDDQLWVVFLDRAVTNGKPNSTTEFV